MNATEKKVSYKHVFYEKVTKRVKRKRVWKPVAANNKRFFRLISEQCNYVDIYQVKEFYYAMLRVIFRELRDRQNIDLPDFCSIHTTIMNNKVFQNLDPVGTMPSVVKERKMIYMKCDPVVKRFINKERIITTNNNTTTTLS